MNCQSFENNVIDLVRRQLIDASLLDQSLAHAESCPTCARQLEDQRRLNLELRGLSDQMALVQPPERIEGQLLMALRAKKFQPQRVATTSPRWIGLAAIAAVLLLVVGVAAVLIRNKSVEPPRAEVNGPKPEPIAVTVPELAVNVTPTAPAAPEKVVHRPRVKRRPRAVDISSLVAANTTAPEITTQFMPLGDVSMANLQDGAQLIRVEMPRYAMARFGIPVNMERYDETVKADVWLGVDGLARAIRFVQ